MRPASIATTQNGRNERRCLAPTTKHDGMTRRKAFSRLVADTKPNVQGGGDAAEPSRLPLVREKHVGAATAAQEPARPAADNEPRRESG